MEEKRLINLIEKMEKDADVKDFEELDTWLDKDLTEEDYSDISLFMHRIATNLYQKGKMQKNAFVLFEGLYNRCFEQILKHVGTSENCYRFSNYVVQIFDYEPNNTTDESEMFHVVFNLFPQRFNQLLLQNEEMSSEVYQLMAEYNMTCNTLVLNENATEDKEFGWTCLKQYVEEGKQQGTYDTELLETMLLRACKIYGADNRLANQDYFEMMLEYVDYITKQEDFNLFQNQGICDLLQIIGNGRGKREQVEQFLKIIKENLKIDKINVKRNEYRALELIQKGELTEEDYDKLFGYLQELKLASMGNLPNQFVDFLIKEALNEDSVLNQKQEKYGCYIERILENFGINAISYKIRLRKPVCYFTRDFLSVDEPDGMKCENVIYLRRYDADYLLEAIDTIFHENTHFEQDYDIGYAKHYTYIRYMIEKEKILEEEFPDYYKNNYSLLFAEIEAREKASLKLIHYLVKTLKTDRVGDVDLKDVIGFYQNDNFLYQMALEKTDSKLEVVRDLNEMVNETIQKKPQLLKKHPILLLEYHDDGSLRTVEELIHTAEENEGRMREVIIKILKNHQVFHLQNIESEIDFLLNYKPKSLSMERLVGYIISEVFGTDSYAQYKSNREQDREGNIVKLLQTSYQESSEEERKQIRFLLAKRFKEQSEERKRVKKQNTTETLTK